VDEKRYLGFNNKRQFDQYTLQKLLGFIAEFEQSPKKSFGRFFEKNKIFAAII
jgi:hypothetical protein